MASLLRLPQCLSWHLIHLTSNTAYQFSVSTVSRALTTAASTKLNSKTHELPSSPAWNGPFKLLESGYLRAYQQKAVDDGLEALKRGVNRIGFSVPTGGGKTRIFSSLVGTWPNPPKTHLTLKDNHRVLILVHKVDLAEQAASVIKLAYPSISVEIEQGAASVASGTADVTIGTFQSMVRRLGKYDWRLFKMIIVDECHHSVSESHLKVLRHFNTGIAGSSKERDVSKYNRVEVGYEELPNVPILGFSATFGRSDNKYLGKVFEEIVHETTIKQLMEQGHLTKVKLTVVSGRKDGGLGRKSHASRGDREGELASLRDAVKKTDFPDLVLRAWQETAWKYKSTLIFCLDIDHIQRISAAFRKAGVDVRYIHSKLPTAEKAQIIEEFKTGKFSVLLNCEILTEGTDVPRVDCVILARPTDSPTLLAQMVGRGLRIFQGKEYCRIIDLVGATRGVLGFGLGTLLGLYEEEILPASRLLGHKHLAGLPEQSSPQNTADVVNKNRSKGVSGISGLELKEVDDPYSSDDTSEMTLYDRLLLTSLPSVNKFAKYKWIDCGNLFALQVIGKGRVIVEPREWTPDGIPTIPSRDDQQVQYITHFIKNRSCVDPRLREKQFVGDSSDLKRAISVGETFASQIVAGNKRAMLKFTPHHNLVTNIKKWHHAVNRRKLITQKVLAAATQRVDEDDDRRR